MKIRTVVIYAVLVGVICFAVYDFSHSKKPLLESPVESSIELPEYKIIKEEFIKEGLLTPWVEIWILVKREATSEEIKSVLYYIYAQTIIKNPQGKYTDYKEKFVIRALYDPDDFPIANILKLPGEEPEYSFNDFLIPSLNK